MLSQDDGIFEEEFIEERRQGLEEFINSLAGHPLVQSEKALHCFLQQERLTKDTFVPGKVRDWATKEIAACPFAIGEAVTIVIPIEIM